MTDQTDRILRQLAWLKAMVGMTLVGTATAVV
jgi:hypothetical protein